MPYQDPDPVDPMTLHGVAFEADDAGPIREMAECFIEEYARLGFDGPRLARVFRTRGHAGPYLAYCTLGERAILQLIDTCLQKRGPARARPRFDNRSNGDVMLPVLESGDAACVQGD